MSRNGGELAAYIVELLGERHRVGVGPGGTVHIGGREVDAELAPTGAPDRHRLLLDGASHALAAGHEGGDGWRLALGGRDFRVEVLEERAARLGALAGGGDRKPRVASLSAPMPGLVVRIEVKEGDEVEEGEALLIVEAMKMENELRATAAARVVHVPVRPGQAVEKGQLLVEFEEAQEA